MMNNEWKADRTETVAIYRNKNMESPPLRTIKEGDGFVVAEWGKLLVVGVYASPRWPLERFEEMIWEIDTQIREKQGAEQVTVIGDFNAKAERWGPHRMNMRGKILLEWATEKELHLINDASTSTFWRWRGESVVDLIWATPGLANRVKKCEVLVEAESLSSDHRYIVMEFTCKEMGCPYDGDGGAATFQIRTNHIRY